MSQLPYDEKLNIGYLGRLFDDTSNCYKFFWFQAILRKLTEEVTRFSYEELVNEIFDADFFAKLYFFCLTMTLRNSL